MGDTSKPVGAEKTVECEVCLKEVPLSEVHVREAEDYVVNFCGLECYDKWVKLADNKKNQPES
jgi:hypothetical protein